MNYALLLAMQAAGMVVDWYGNKQQIELGRMGSKIEQAGIESNIANNKLQYENDSLEAMKQLRSNLGTQAAMFAARGTQSGSGTAAAITNESLSNASSDERMRRMNMLGRDAQLRAGKTISELHQAGNEQAIWGQFGKSVFEKISTNPSTYGFSGLSGRLAFAGSRSGAKSFLTPIGG